MTVLGRAGLRYREGSQTVLVDGEMLMGAFDFGIHENSIRVWEGSGAPIDDGKRKAIIANIESAFHLARVSLAVEP